MERFKQGLRSLAEEGGSNSSSFRGSEFSSGQTQVVVRRAHGQVVSLWTCSKVCAISFAVGVVVGFTLKRRLRRWATKLLKRWKDD
ncbi:uncharacterized protein LOC131228163 [Magnolia sinica]|uniref:uncharacterized protein LOC131228163 n=1 Tax=Magnolia sinica TaxID=86752 RepID=UPI0026585948|nr:uncharacterized protein LOC131228163 [Magnolia sinica]